MNGEKENGTMKKVCKACGTVHDELRNCPDLVPGYPQSADGKADRLDQTEYEAYAYGKPGIRL